AHGREVDAFVLCPAMIEAGRFTEDDIHYATVDGRAVEVAQTDFARDATFGYSHSDLREFLAERSGGAIAAADVLRISLADIRSGGTRRVREILAAARDRTWVVVNATEYTDMEVVAAAIAELESEGRTFVTRCAPSFVRPLAGQSGARVGQAESITIPAGRLEHGLGVVGSHVGRPTTQLPAGQRVRPTPASAACGLYPGRDPGPTADPAASLETARSGSGAGVESVRRVRTARPAWVVATGGITSHEVAAHGLGIRRARVEG